MDKVLRKLAETLNSLDEASLMSLREKYYQRVKEFSPSQAWEEDTLILSMIQAVRWKNQLFNHHWAATDNSPPQQPLDHEEKSEEEKSGPNSGNISGRAGKVLNFRSLKKD
ncbi:MAG: hypothetical protein ACLFMP_06890 [Desulfonatronovibrionaceae bacterium]